MLTTQPAGFKPVLNQKLVKSDHEQGEVEKLTTALPLLLLWLKKWFFLNGGRQRERLIVGPRPAPRVVLVSALRGVHPHLSRSAAVVVSGGAADPRFGFWFDSPYGGPMYRTLAGPTPSNSLLARGRDRSWAVCWLLPRVGCFLFFLVLLFREMEAQTKRPKL